MNIVDAVTMPTGEMTPVQLLSYTVPQDFVAHFLIRDETPLGRNVLNWSVELRIRIGEMGTPLLQSLTHRGLTDQNQIIMNGLGNYLPLNQHMGVSRKQIATVEKHLGDLLDFSLSLMLKSHQQTEDGGFTVLTQSRKISVGELQRFRKEMKNRSAKTKLTPEFLKRISKIYLLEVARSQKAGDRCRTTEAIWEATSFQSDKRTVETWVSKARKDGFLSESSKKKVSASTAGSKASPKARKEKK